MTALPDLDQLSHGEKDDLIRALFAMAKLVKVDVLTAGVTEPEGRLALNSQNSSKPPSADGLNRPKPKSLRDKGVNLTGGQKGHSGHTLKQVAHPDCLSSNTGHPTGAMRVIGYYPSR